jgi:uncharacterized Zn finger protein (UPF0148 family)
MSDFDAEAERKRLREKYESEEEDRKRTQQMSELLLKGATMTNRHCGECGSPIFQYEGQEFCPSCQRTAGGTAEEESTTGDGTTPVDNPSGDAETVETDATAGGTTAESKPEAGTPAANGAAASNGSGPGVDAGAAGQQDTAVTPGRSDDTTAGRHEEVAERRDASVTDTVGASDTPDPTRATAYDALYTALTRHARHAADTDDPRRASEHLSAAREAAAAIDELGGT